MTEEIDAAFNKIIKTIEAAHLPERNIDQLTLYPANKPVEPYIPRATTGIFSEIPKYIPGPQKLTIEEYRKRQNRKSNLPKSTRGGRRNRLQKEIIGYKKLLQIVTTETEKAKYNELIQRAKKELNKIKRKNRK